MKTTVGRRGVKGAKRPDTQQLKEWLSKGLLVTALGVVRQFPGQSSHFDIDTDIGREILVDVELTPSGERVLCRLGFGVDQDFKIPRVDQEVAVLIPFHPQSLIKDPIDFEPIIVGVLDLNVPTELSGDGDRVIKASNKVTIDAPTVTCGAETGSEKAVKGQTYRSSEDTLFTALSTFSAAISAFVAAVSTFAGFCTGPTSPQLSALTGAATTLEGACTTMEGAISSFQSGASTYLAQQAKVT